MLMAVFWNNCEAQTSRNCHQHTYSANFFDCQARESGSTITLDGDFYDHDKYKEPENAQAKMSRNNYKKGKIILTLFGIFFIVLFAYYTIAGNSPRPINAPWNTPIWEQSIWPPHFFLPLLLLLQFVYRL